MKVPSWLKKEVVLAMHERLLTEHGGSAGIRDEAMLESARARPEDLLAYGTPTIHSLAAAYAYGIIKNHPFVDGNKRTGFMAAYVFLGVNGVELTAEESDVVLRTLAVAGNQMTEEDYADWLKKNSAMVKILKKKKS